MTIDLKNVAARPLPAPAPRGDAATSSTPAPTAPAQNTSIPTDGFSVTGTAAAGTAPAAQGAVPEGTEVIDVYFHVINKGKTARQGNVPPKQIRAQIKVLNEAYRGTGFQFRLADVDRTTNKNWYSAESGSRAEQRMKAALRQGDSEALNIYAANPGGGLLGWATMPADYGYWGKSDGVVLLNSSLPGARGGAPYNEGDTGVHEVGHWMGLNHTFENDGVKDTPVHEVNYGKPAEGTDTRPDKKGKDPIHNYMNYVDDAWMHEFTPGQVRRMQNQWAKFRETDAAAVA